MAITPQQSSALDRTIARESLSVFAREFNALLFHALQIADQGIVAQVAQMPPVFPEPLAEGTRVILRQRIIYLIFKGEHAWMVGGQQLGDSWDAKQLERALTDKGRCPFSSAQLRTLDGLCEHYATAIRDERIAPVLDGWLQAEADRLARQPELRGLDYTKISNSLLRKVQGALYNDVVKNPPIQLRIEADKIRDKPYGQ